MGGAYDRVHMEVRGHNMVEWTLSFHHVRTELMSSGLAAKCLYLLPH